MHSGDPWAEIGPMDEMTWLSHCFKKKKNVRLTFKKTEISHKNLDYWLLWKNQKLLEHWACIPAWKQWAGVDTVLVAFSCVLSTPSPATSCNICRHNQPASLLYIIFLSPTGIWVGHREAIQQLQSTDGTLKHREEKWLAWSHTLGRLWNFNSPSLCPFHDCITSLCRQSA